MMPLPPKGGRREKGNGALRRGGTGKRQPAGKRSLQGGLGLRQLFARTTLDTAKGDRHGHHQGEAPSAAAKVLVWGAKGAEGDYDRCRRRTPSPARLLRSIIKLK
ncbi:protocadherin-8 [Platysternon megacephalum]|uniref:Protocadherin-8 n=1 Tax=Platysternon megacephalum TaxID=55544 RepID=A0A4D9F6L1_9SAUR|nr:protocadherin-8 [Platysternon megacephalum]